MAGLTHQDLIIDYKVKIIDLLAKSKEVVGLLLDMQNIDIEGVDAKLAYTVYDNNLYDFNYLDGTIQEARSFIMVEVEIPEQPTDTIIEAILYVQVVVPKSDNKLKKENFKGLWGNRTDNLIRFCDLVLSGNRNFGIGKLEFVSNMIANAPDAFTSKLLTYRVPDFAKDRNLINDQNRSF